MAVDQISSSFLIHTRPYRWTGLFPSLWSCTGWRVHAVAVTSIYFFHYTIWRRPCLNLTFGRHFLMSLVRLAHGQSLYTSAAVSATSANASRYTSCGCDVNVRLRISPFKGWQPSGRSRMYGQYCHSGPTLDLPHWDVQSCRSPDHGVVKELQQKRLAADRWLAVLYRYLRSIIKIIFFQR